MRSAAEPKKTWTWKVWKEEKNESNAHFSKPWIFGVADLRAQVNDKLTIIQCKQITFRTEKEKKHESWTDGATREKE